MHNIQLQWSVCGLWAMMVFSLFRIVVVLKVDQHFLDSWNKLICIFDTWDNCLESCILYYTAFQKVCFKGMKAKCTLPILLYIVLENACVLCSEPDVFPLSIFLLSHILTGYHGKSAKHIFQPINPIRFYLLCMFWNCQQTADICK